MEGYTGPLPWAAYLTFPQQQKPTINIYTLNSKICFSYIVTKTNNGRYAESTKILRQIPNAIVRNNLPAKLMGD